MFYLHLAVKGGFPDPELAIRFDKSNILCGYLPWETRLTEFL